MLNMRDNQKGFGIFEIIIIIIILGILGFLGWNFLAHQQRQSATQPTDRENSSESTTQLLWQQTDGGWRSLQTPPVCKQPLFKMPTDISKVTSVLYPGQTRGGNYKPHGGFRFDTSADNAVLITAPTDGYIVRGARYMAEGEVQYTFDIMNNCGVLYRVGHLRVLPEKLQKLADTWPAPSDSSATQSVNPPIYIKQGEVLATKIGILSTKNTFFDWGVYDYRKENEASLSANYRAAHTQDKDLSWHAVCWLKDWLPATDTSILTSLPAGDPSSGKNSDYCQ